MKALTSILTIILLSTFCHCNKVFGQNPNVSFLATGGTDLNIYDSGEYKEAEFEYLFSPSYIIGLLIRTKFNKRLALDLGINYYKLNKNYGYTERIGVMSRADIEVNTEKKLTVEYVMIPIGLNINLGDHVSLNIAANGMYRSYNGSKEKIEVIYLLSGVYDYGESSNLYPKFPAYNMETQFGIAQQITKRLGLGFNLAYRYDKLFGYEFDKRLPKVRVNIAFQYNLYTLHFGK